MKSEKIASFVLIFLLLLTGGAVVLVANPSFREPAGAVTLHARMPENGGWSTDTLYAAVGVPLKLRMTSDDVLHSFSVGQSGQTVDLVPGKWQEMTLTFDKPGRYTYYCERWCGKNHWRMRGTIIVTGGEQGSPAAAAPQPPLYVTEGLDLDAPHLAGAIPPGATSSQRGAELAARLPAWALDRQAYLLNSPAAMWQKLRAEPALSDLSDPALWDAVAFLWSRQTSPESLAEASRLYATNCAACHGETGRGDGVMVEGLPVYTPGEAHTSPTAGDGSMAGHAMDGAGEAGSMGLSAPQDLTDPRITLGASPALLEGKMLRGGMGTGMPNWGPIFTPDQMDAIVAYLYTFSLER